MDPDAVTQDGDGPDTDHVLIVGSNVFAIDSKRWKSRRKYSVSDKGIVMRSGRSFPGGRVHAREGSGPSILAGTSKSAVSCVSTMTIYLFNSRKDTGPSTL